MPHRLKCLELKNLPRAPSPLKSINFRHTTPGSGLALVTNHQPQSTSELFDPTYPGAHLPLGKRRSLAPRWIHPSLSLFALPKAFLTKPDVPYPEPYKSRPYPESLRRPEQRSVDMSMQFVSFKSHIVLKPVVRTKIKRRLREVVKLIVTRGAAVEESRTGQKVVVFRGEDVGADKWIVPDWTYIARPTTELFRMPFAELLDLMRKALESLHRRIPEVESILRRHRRPDATSLNRKKNSACRPSSSSLEATISRHVGRETAAVEFSQEVDDMAMERSDATEAVINPKLVSNPVINEKRSSKRTMKRASYIQHTTRARGPQNGSK